MQICWQGFLGNNHSWSVVAQHISRNLIRLGHKVDLFSTNGIKHFPDDLKPYLKGYVEENHGMHLDQLNRYADQFLQKQYDCQLSYTFLKNFQYYFSRGNKNRFGIWTYEFAGKNAIPSGYSKCHKFVDKVLAPTQFSKQIFLDSGMPSEVIKVIPHGVDIERFKSAGKYQLKTNKRFKILANIAQPHLRKNLPGLLTAFGKAFTKKDDVCLVLKVVDKLPQQQFEVSFRDIFNIFELNYKNHAEIEIITEFIPEIESLYNACDAVFTMSFAEGFYLPGLESFAANKLTIAPNYGGQLDFMTEDNSLLIPGQISIADPKMLYWAQSMKTTIFRPNTDKAADILRAAYDNYDNLMERFIPNMKKTLVDFTWEKVAKDIVGLCNE